MGAGWCSIIIANLISPHFLFILNNVVKSYKRYLNKYLITLFDLSFV